MDYQIEKKDKLSFVGIPIRTSNVQFMQDVPPLWNCFFQESLGEKIANRRNDQMVAVYTDYEGDYTQPFGYLVGCEAKNLNEIPEGMRGVEVPARTYAVYTAKGELSQAMLKAWQAIWKSNLKRSYTTDFEIYPPHFHTQAEPEVKIYIAIA